jgi:hypothetical protein
MSRRDAAIRDYYDVDYAVTRLGVDVLTPDLITLVAAKMNVAGNDPVDVSPERLAALRPQLDTELRAVLRTQDFMSFELDRAFETVGAVAQAVDLSQPSS